MRRRIAFRGALWACLVAALAARVAAPARAAERVVEIPTRPGVTVKFILSDPRDSNAPIVLLFAGGHGIIGLDHWNRKGNPTANFLVRTRKHWVRHGLLVAVPDAPSDRQSDGLTLWRTSRDHAADIRVVIRHLRRYSTGPAFLVGTSRGTISAAGAAANMAPGELGGIILTASVTRYNRGRDKDRVQSARIGNIRIPVLFAHHEDDACDVTAPEDLPDLAKEFANAPSVEIKTYTGGGGYRDSECGNRTAHGFRGIEKRVVRDIAAWIKRIAARTP